MAQKYDVLIFSLFGRNHWLASQLKSSGLSVALMDLSPLFQKGLAEDWEGPFPLIFPDSVARSNSQSYTDQDRSELLHRGPSLRVRGRGLFEFKSDHVEYMLNRWEQSGLWVSQEDGPPQFKNSGKSSVQELDFKSIWLRSFFKQWRSNTLKSLRDVDDSIPDFPLNSNYILRHPSRRGYMESSDWLKDTGVEVIKASAWWRLVFKDEKWILNLEQPNIAAVDPSLESELPTTFESEEIQMEAKTFILGLTSYELQKFSGQISIPEFEMTTPAAFWVRWRASTANIQGLDFIPSYSMFLSDPEFGVYSENFVTLIKRSNNELDVWACVSYEALSDFEFQLSIQNLVKQKLSSFVPELGDIQLDDLRLGSDLFSFWPLYKSRKSFHKPNLNLFLDSPESWMGLDNHSRYMGQTELIESLKKSIPISPGV